MAQPQNHADPPAPSALPLLVAVGVGLVAAMLTASVAPRLTDNETVSWILTLVVAVVAAMAAFGAVARRRTTTVRRPGER